MLFHYDLSQPKADMEDSMKNRVFAICDKDKVYLEMLQSYLMKKKPVGYEIQVYTSVADAIRESEDGFEILLIGESTFDDNARKINTQKMFILQEDGLSGIKGYTFISKYQSIENMVKQSLEAFAQDDDCMSKTRCGKSNTKIISFYSPDRHSGQVVSSLCAGELLADQGNRVLYISMSPFSGFEELLGKEYEADITDFMYFALKHSQKLLYKLESIKCTLRNMDYLPPALDYSDLFKITSKEWEKVLDALSYSGDYTHIVVDLAETCQGFYHILDRSNDIYILSKNTSRQSMAMLTQYEKLLQAKGFDKILSKSHTFDLNSDWEEDSYELDKLPATRVGAHMKGIIQKCL